MLDFLEKHKDITELSNFKTPAKAKFYYEINSEDDISKLNEIFIYSKENNIKILFIGWWTNLLLAFDEYDWIIIKNNLEWWKYDEKTKLLETFSNEMMSSISEELETKYKQNIWHRFIWLPGSVGWAIFWNAGCFGLETENNFLEIDVYNIENGQFETLSKKQMDFSYRSSLLKEQEGKYFIIKARFDLSKIVEKYASDKDNIHFREHKQPKGNICWSFFKNPSKELSAWYLIEKVGLKWYNVWGASFSCLHANFLMNDWWTNNDLLELIDIAIDKVKYTYDVELIPEVRIIKN